MARMSLPQMVDDFAVSGLRNVEFLELYGTVSRKQRSLHFSCHIDYPLMVYANCRGIRANAVWLYLSMTCQFLTWRTLSGKVFPAFQSPRNGDRIVDFLTIPTGRYSAGVVYLPVGIRPPFLRAFPLPLLRLLTNEILKSIIIICVSSKYSCCRG